MKKASKLFTEQEKQAIKKAVAEAERKTSGEIVPVVATASGRYDRAEDIVGVLTALLAVSLAWLFFQDVRTVSGDWASGQALKPGLLSVLGIFTGGFILGSAAATYFPALKLPFIPGKELREEVERSAAAAFHSLRVRRTRESAGVLIYVSLFERIVRVEGDETIGSRLSPSDWEEVCGLTTRGLRDGRACEGLCLAIASCGELLGRLFPIRPGDTNELDNELNLID